MELLKGNDGKKNPKKPFRNQRKRGEEREAPARVRKKRGGKKKKVGAVAQTILRNVSRKHRGGKKKYGGGRKKKKARGAVGEKGKGKSKIPKEWRKRANVLPLQRVRNEGLGKAEAGGGGKKVCLVKQRGFGKKKGNKSLRGPDKTSVVRGHFLKKKSENLHYTLGESEELPWSQHESSKKAEMKN